MTTSTRTAKQPKRSPFMDKPAIARQFKLCRRGKYARFMQDFNVSEASLYHFEQEYLRGKPMHFWKIILTEHWAYSTDGCLLPLKEVMWACHSGRMKFSGRGSHFQDQDLESISLYFCNGVRFRLDFDVTGLHYMLKFLAERCPNAEVGKYSLKREREWKQNAKQWRKTHR